MADFERVIQVHLMGTAYMTRAAWPVMAKQKYGRVIVTTSTSIFGSSMQAAYSAANMGVWGLMTALGLEGEALGIRVNGIAPCARQGHGRRIPGRLHAGHGSRHRRRGAGLSRQPARAPAPGFVCRRRLFNAPDRRFRRPVHGPQTTAETIRDRFPEIEAMSAPLEFEIVTDHIGQFNQDLGISSAIWRASVFD